MKTISIRCVVVTIGLFASLAMSQTTAPPVVPGEITISGTVASSSGTTLVVRLDNGSHQLFVFDRHGIKPASIPIGSTVRVISTPGDDPSMRVANHITIVSPPSTAESKDSEQVPLAVRQMERDIARQVRKFGVGLRAGASLDPEVLLIGAHAKMGPFFTRELAFRPNVEFGWGEVTKQFAFNAEAVYRLPFTPRQGRWSAYVGAGPSFLFAHQNFERAESGDNGIDFGDFQYTTGLNILTGIEFRSGVFLEVKTTVYAQPHFRLMMGYTF